MMRCVPVLIAAALVAVPAAASEWVYTYQGHLPAGVILGGTTLTTPTPFTFSARFDDASPNLAAPVGVPGFVAYAPLKATLRADGRLFDLQPWNGSDGVAVAIFSGSTPFGGGHVASGFIQNILADGAGIVGDWLPSTGEPFDASGALQPFTMRYSDFFGVGYGIGPCLSACRTPGEVDLTQPLPATEWRLPTSITLVSEDPTYIGYPQVGPPFTPFRDEATLAVPEPATLAIFGLGMFGAAVQRRHVRR